MRKNKKYTCLLIKVHTEFDAWKKEEEKHAKSMWRKIGERTVKRAISRVAVHWSPAHGQFAAEGVPWRDDAMVYEAREGPTNQRERTREKRERERGWTVATSRKQSGRRPLKILLRIVCHFTSERSRRMERAPLSSLRGESARTNLGVHRFVRYYLHIYVGITYKALLLSPTDAIPRWLPIFQIHQTPPLAPIIP